jgi:signal transduction histidine kinase
VKPTPETSSFDALRDAILRGMAHALSNRVAALGGINGLADPGEIWTERLSKALHDEARRLEDILRLMRLLPNDGRGEPGAIELQPLVPDVIALHAYQSALLQVECAAVYDRETMPVFANRPQLVHALLLAIEAAKRHAHARGGRVSVSYAGDADRVTIRVATEPAAAPGKGGAAAPEGTAPGIAETATALRAAIAGVGGPSDVAVAADGEQLRIELPVPTLAAGRRSQLAARPTTA